MLILQGDVLDRLRELPDESVHVVVTSPPYWSLRDYLIPPSIFGGNPRCDHEWASAGTKEGFTSKRKWQHSENGRGEVSRAEMPEGWGQIEQGQFCPWCGAWKGQLGLEPTPELFVAHTVMVFREVRRVLRRDGTLWLNIGDSYASGGGAARQGVDGSLASRTVAKSNQYRGGNRIGSRSGFLNARQPRRDVEHKSAPRLKAKDLVGIPWRLAFAMQADGWYLRSDIIWAKPNPMPESALDRPTKSHEYLFLFAKNGRYFYDGEAIREETAGTAHERGDGLNPKAKAAELDRKLGPRPKQNASFSAAISGGVGFASRNKRDVWTIQTQPTEEEHFAAYPEDLVEPCIRAGTSAHGCCGTCGAPYKRLVEKGDPLEDQRRASGGDAAGSYSGAATKAYDGTGAQDPSAVKKRILEGMRERRTVGWKATCRCKEPGELVVATVLDPFSGIGRTGVVAEKLRRRYIGIELNPQSAEISRRLIGQVAPLFSEAVERETAAAQAVLFDENRSTDGDGQGLSRPRTTETGATSPSQGGRTERGESAGVVSRLHGSASATPTAGSIPADSQPEETSDVRTEGRAGADREDPQSPVDGGEHAGDAKGSGQPVASVAWSEEDRRELPGDRCDHGGDRAVPADGPEGHGRAAAEPVTTD